MTKVIYNKCLGYNRMGAIIEKTEKTIEDVVYLGKVIDLIDYTTANANKPWVKIAFGEEIYFELMDRLPQIDL